MEKNIFFFSPQATFQLKPLGFVALLNVQANFVILKQVFHPTNSKRASFLQFNESVACKLH